MVRNPAVWIGSCVVACALGAAGVWWSTPEAGGVAVVDLEEIARQLGQDEEMIRKIEAQKGSLTQQLQAAQQQVRQELAQLRAGLGANPTQEEARNYQAAELKYQQELAKLQNRANALLNEQGKQVLREFRDATRPVAVEVARERGLKTVIAKDNGIVFAFDAEVDITADVIARMKAAAPAKSSSPAVPAGGSAESASEIVQTAATVPAPVK